MQWTSEEVSVAAAAWESLRFWRAAAAVAVAVAAVVAIAAAAATSSSSTSSNSGEYQKAEQAAGSWLPREVEESTNVQ